MKKSYCVVIDVSGGLAAEIIHKHLKKIGKLKDIPKDAEMKMLDGFISIEYSWEKEEEIEIK